MITVNGIHKSFGAVRAVRGVSFDAPDGKITGLLGPNGAGKSTTLRVLYTVLRPDEGTASIDGADVVTDALEARKRIGALPHGAGLYPHLTARENIAYFARLCGLDKSEIDDRVAEEHGPQESHLVEPDVHLLEHGRSIRPHAAPQMK